MSKGLIGFDPKIRRGGTFRSFWSTGTGWGEVVIEDGVAVIEVVGGVLNVAAIAIQHVHFGVVELAAAAAKDIAHGHIELAAGAVISLRNPAIKIANNKAI